MPQGSEPVVHAVLREALRRAYKALGFDGPGALYEALRKTEPAVLQSDELNVRKYVNGQNISGPTLARLSAAVKALLSERTMDLAPIFERRGETESIPMVLRALSETPEADPAGLVPPAGAAVSDELARRRNLRVIFENWARPVASGGVIRSGVYQIIRRYKPVKEEKEKISAYRDDENHAVICELAYVDSDAMECVLITAERNLYWGAMYVNHQNILYVLAQRPSSEYGNSVYQRIYSVRLEGRAAVYSGLCLKSGDTTTMPLAAECLFVEISDNEYNKELYLKFKELFEMDWCPYEVPEKSIFMDYITDIPLVMSEVMFDRARPRVKRISEFRWLADMVKEKNGVIFFRESLRALPASALRIQIGHRPPVFRHSAGGPRGGRGSGAGKSRRPPARRQNGD